MTPAQTPADAPRAFSGLERAVAVLSAMGRPVAARLVEHFDEDERTRMLAAASTLGNLPPEAIEAVVAQFEAAFVAGVGAMDNLANLEAVFERKLQGDGPATDPVWVRAERSIDELARVLADENPQLTTMVALRLTPRGAARLVAALPRERGADAVRRIATARPAAPEAVVRVEAHLERLLSRAEGSGDDPGPLTTILKELDREMAEALIADSALPEGTVARVRGGLFDFADLARLSSDDRATLLDAVEGDALVAALSGAGAAVSAAVLEGLSPRTRRMVEAQLGTARADPTAAETARRSIAADARALARAGRIALPDAT